ncbi:MAG: molybdopterin-dependent oxidoreductase [Chloroflexi bacterium]|nr:molybdopterin-dependent oxidoreductase [Chloroflexota bacterium]MCC6892431.1 molybdopterin-dependent oxidoreductase [Anaerolineae bacterium]
MLTIDGAVAQPQSFSLTDLQERFPQRTVHTRYANDDRVATAAYTGVLLWDLLQTAQPILNTDQPELMRVMARSTDGFRCIVKWHEFAPSAENKLILVGCLQNGQPLDDRYGPLRLVVPGDKQGVRYIRHLASLTVLNQHSDDQEVQ